MTDIGFLDEKDAEEVLPVLFGLLSSNMERIDPSGAPPGEDYRIWKDYRLSEMGKPGRETLLLQQDGSIIEYFQYSIKDSVLLMEEIQFDPSVWGTGVFRELYRYLAGVIPEDVTAVEAYAGKKNLRSQAILKHLGLEISGENNSGRSFHFTGDCRKMLERYRLT